MSDLNFSELSDGRHAQSASTHLRALFQNKVARNAVLWVLAQLWVATVCAGMIFVANVLNYA